MLCQYSSLSSTLGLEFDQTPPPPPLPMCLPSVNVILHEIHTWQEDLPGLPPHPQTSSGVYIASSITHKKMILKLFCAFGFGSGTEARSPGS